MRYTYLADNLTDITNITDLTANTGYWLKKTKEASLAFYAEERDTEPTSNSELLLKDVEYIFADVMFFSKDKIKTEELLDKLHNITESPWSAYFHGKPLDARGLGRLLRPHGIRPKTIWFDRDIEAKGYYKADFADAWKRYLPTHHATAVSSVTNVIAVREQVNDRPTDLAVIPVTNVRPVRHFEPF